MTDFTLGPGPLMPEFEQIKSDIGIVENGATATHAISSGSYVIWNGDLYVAKMDISSGTALGSSNLTPKTSGIGGEVKSLSEKTGTYVFESDTLENTQTAIYNYVGSMADGEQKRIRFSISAISGIFSATSYIGDLRRLSRSRFVVTAQQAMNNTRMFVGRYKDGVWDWQQTASKSDIDTLSEQIGTKAKFLNLTSSDSAATAYAKLNALSNLDVATIFIDGAVMNNFTSGAITTSANGLVVKGNASTYRYNLMIGASTKTVIFTMNNVSASSWGTIAYFHDIYDQIETHAIEQNTDLNNLTTVGNYECATNTISASLLHCPVSSTTFTMWVRKRGPYMQQIIVTVINEVYIRNQGSSGWADWQKLAHNPYFPSSFQNNYNTVFSDMGDVTGSRYDIIASGASNAPFSAYGLCYTMKRYANETTTLGIQMAMLVNNEVYKRTYNNGTWSSWQQLSSILTVSDSISLGALAANASGYQTKQITVPSGYKCIGIMAQSYHVGIIGGNLMLDPLVTENGMVYISYRAFASIAAADAVVIFTVICKA